MVARCRRAERGAKPSGPITLDQLLALNEEIAALVRAGVPLDRGLLEAGRDVRGRLGRIAGVLGRRLNRGEGLAEALEAERRAIPPLYRAVVEAGARAGRLPAALEGMARYIRGVSDARAIDRAGALVSRAGAVPGVRAVRRRWSTWWCRGSWRRSNRWAWRRPRRCDGWSGWADRRLLVAGRAGR